MKRYLGIFSIALLSIALNSCMEDEATDNIYLSYRAIDSIQIEQINPARQVTEIKTFTRKILANIFLTMIIEFFGMKEL